MIFLDRASVPAGPVLVTPAVDAAAPILLQQRRLCRFDKEAGSMFYSEGLLSYSWQDGSVLDLLNILDVALVLWEPVS